MLFVIIGVLLLAAKFAEVGPTAGWSWWIVLSPFLAAVLWWAFADSTGLTKKRAMDKMEQRKADRRRKAAEALGLTMKSTEREEALRRARAAVTNPIERKRAAKRAENKQSILDSVQHTSQFDDGDGAPPRREPKA